MLMLNHFAGFGARKRPGFWILMSGSTNWTYYAPHWTFSGANVVRADTSQSYCAYHTAVLTDDFEWQCTQVNLAGNAPNSFQFGIASSALTTNDQVSSSAAADSWWIRHQGVGAGRSVELMHNASSLGSAVRTIASGDTFTIRRSGGKLTALHNGVEIGTFAASGHTGAYRPIFGHGGAAFELVGYNTMRYRLM